MTSHFFLPPHRRFLRLSANNHCLVSSRLRSENFQVCQCTVSLLSLGRRIIWWLGNILVCVSIRIAWPIFIPITVAVPGAHISGLQPYIASLIAHSLSWAALYPHLTPPACYRERMVTVGVVEWPFLYQVSFFKFDSAQSLSTRPDGTQTS